MRVPVGAAALLLLAGAPAAPVDLGAYAAPLRFTSAQPLAVGGDHEGRYTGTVEVRPGLLLVDELPVEAYVEGIAEMPNRWPLEALKAQAVAARTYAWHVALRRSYDGYDICATVACQVFAGLAAVEHPLGTRWQRAVRDTAGEVIVDARGAPILARYHSSSGGRTRDNDRVFTGEAPRPELRGVNDPADAVSPWHRWQVVFTRAEFDTIAAGDPELAPATPVAAARVVAGRPDVVELTGTRGTRVTVPVADFRRHVSAVAPRLFPARFPSRTGLRRLPQTIPSTRFTLTVSDRTVVVDGGGFGHGVGMSQYGALGLAQDGRTFDDILAVYYGGLRPQRSEILPETVRVGLADGLRRVTIRPDGPMTVTVGDEQIADQALGVWTVTGGRDGTLRLAGPPGYGAPLVVAGAEARNLRGGEVVTVRTVVSRPAQMELVVTDAAGASRLRRSLGPVDAGEVTATWDTRDAPPGRYRMRFVARDGAAEVASAPATVDVADASPARDQSGRAGPPVALIALTAGLVAVTGAAVVRYRVRGRR